MKILHLPTSVGGNSWGLSRGERALGLESDVLYQSTNYFDYPADIMLDNSGSFAKMMLKSVKAAFDIRSKYQVLHFNFGASLIDIPERGIHHWDLPLYKNQKLFVTYNGCDARQKYLRINQTENCACRLEGCVNTLCITKRRDESKAHRIAQFEKAGAGFFAVNPDLLNFLPASARFLPYTITGWDEIQPAPILQNKDKLVVVHAPTNKLLKGTGFVLEAVEAIQKKYPNKIDFRLIEGLPHAQALEAYSRADLVIDQLHLGWYGGFAAEVMKMGKPVMTYINRDDLHFCPSQLTKDLLEAIIEVDHHTITDQLEKYVQQPTLLLEKSNAAKEYVHRWHTPERVAEMTKAAYEAAFNG